MPAKSLPSMAAPHAAVTATIKIIGEVRPLLTTNQPEKASYTRPGQNPDRSIYLSMQPYV